MTLNTKNKGHVRDYVHYNGHADDHVRVRDHAVDHIHGHPSDHIYVPDHALDHAPGNDHPINHICGHPSNHTRVRNHDIDHTRDHARDRGHTKFHTHAHSSGHTNPHTGDYNNCYTRNHDHSSSESLNFLIPKKKKEKNLEEKNLEKRETMKELFKEGNSIEIVYNQGPQYEKKLVVFSISSILGMGAYGIVVLANIPNQKKKRSRNSITVEITDSNIKQILEKLDEKNIRNLKEKKLAIKIMDLEANDSAELEDPLIIARKEISIMSELQDCEQILKYYVTFSSASFLYILMEYAEGGSLYNLYNKYGCFPEELLASVIQDILKALRRLHGKDHSKSQHYILHNDIKSANILLSYNCVAKLADFGVSRKIHPSLKQREKNSDSNNREILGSPFWMAPEIILGNSFSELMGKPGASDIWSLGITVLELAFGRIPWPNFESLEELLGHILRSPPPQKIIRKDIKGLFSTEFWDFVDCCLIKDPNLRKSAEDLLKHPFIIFKAKRPNSLKIFIETISGVQIHNSNYIQNFLNYVNHFFSSGAKVSTKYHSLSSQNFIKKISSVSISKYFSRKRSSITQNIQNISIKSSKSLKALENHQNSKLSLNLCSSTYKDENGSLILDKRVSMAQIYKCLESPSIEVEKLKLENTSQIYLQSASQSYSQPNSNSSSSSLLLQNEIPNIKIISEEEKSNISEDIYTSYTNDKKQTEEKFIDVKKNNKNKKPIETVNTNKKNTSKSKTRKSAFFCCCSKNANNIFD